MDQVLAAAEPALDVRAGRRGVVLDHFLGRGNRHADEIGVALHVGKAQQWIAALPFAQVLARPALRPIRPRSWWSCESPNRSALSITMSEAFGTSTPTSMTVVQTRSSTLPATKSSMTFALSTGSMRP